MTKDANEWGASAMHFSEDKGMSFLTVTGPMSIEDLGNALMRVMQDTDDSAYRRSLFLLNGNEKRYRIVVDQLAEDQPMADKISILNGYKDICTLRALV